MRSIKIITLFLICVSCNIENNTPGKIKVYYPIDSVLNQQKEQLVELNPLLFKIARVDHQQDTTSIRLSKTEWEQEMQIFNDITINKPALRDSYNEDTVKLDSGQWIKYTAKDNLRDKVEIEYMNLFFDSNEKLRKVDLFYKEHGSLYDAQRIMNLNFTQEQKLAGYQVKGFQKIILKDTINYQVNASIQY